ncbi:MAG TPA: NAD(P)H-binding protein [Candidatus Saccharimonadales bacterium]|nr:NAD(P)H-binding protein [Candidatus Saccharimonadales bacterium]
MILVTAATGRPGLTVVKELSRNNIAARALYRTVEKANVLDNLPGIEPVEGDMMMPHTLGNALKDIDVVLMISGAGPELLETQITFIDACKAAGVKHIVKFSGEDSIVGFDAEKFRSTRNHAQIERYLMASGMAWTILRPSQFMEVYLEEVPTIVAEDAVILPAGNVTMAPVALVDVAKIASAILQDYKRHASQIYKITGPEALTIAQICSDISEALGRTITYVDCSIEEKIERWLKLGYPEVRARVFAQLWAERKAKGISKTYLGTHDWFNIPPTTMKQFASDNAAAFKGEVGIQMTAGIK